MYSYSRRKDWRSASLDVQVEVNRCAGSGAAGMGPLSELELEACVEDSESDWTRSMSRRKNWRSASLDVRVEVNTDSRGIGAAGMGSLSELELEASVP